MTRARIRARTVLRIGGAMLCATCFGGCDYLQRPPASLATDLRVSVTPLAMPDRKVWGLVVADFDQDGDDDFLLAGHGGKQRDRIYYYDGGRYQASSFEFPRAADRHGCSAADINGDTLPDVYCTAGAERGAGRNDNELFLSLGDGRYRRAEPPFGAEDPFGRGRLSAFLRANDDAEPDLLGTVWGAREDSEVNETRVFLNTGTPAHTAFTAGPALPGSRSGGRCLAVLNIDGDGHDELALCRESQGAILLQNQGDGRFRSVPLPRDDAWWLDLRSIDGLFIGAMGNGHHSLAALLLDRRGGSLWIFSPDSLRESSPQPERKLALGQLPGRRARHCIPVSLAVAKNAAPGKPGALITRVQADDNTFACPHNDDILLLGAALDRYLPVPGPANGRRSQVYAANGHFLRLSAGEGWDGIVEVIRLLPGDVNAGRRKKSPSESSATW